MPRRHGRMFLRGKPGLFMLVAVVTIGIFLAYYTFGRSSVKPNKYAMYKNARVNGKFPSYQIPKSNKGFSDMVFNKNFRQQQVPKPVLPQPDFGAQRNFGGMRKTDLSKDTNVGGKGKILQRDESRDQFQQNFGRMRKDGSQDRDVVDEDYNFEGDDKAGPHGDQILRSPIEAISPSIYSKPDEAFSPLFKSMKRIVHLDLKGAFPKLDYLEKVLPLFQRLGATGLLVEYEDMFPYAGDLSMLGAENAYSIKDILRLLELAKKNNLEVIPLIQTFGHMEFVLKHAQYQHLRETPNLPQVISPMHNDSYKLIGMMIEQVLAVHTDARYLHIGSDEVYDLGEGKTHALIVGGKTKDEIILQHMSRVAALVKSKRTIGVIVWDDELRSVAEKLIVKSGLNTLVEPMVWCYIPDPRKKLPGDIWVKYGKLFNGIWAASSFKGATGSAQFYTNISHHLQNHLSWVDIIKKMKNEMPVEKFRGVALTGWQRYDHYATLCELLPEAIPSLAVCLETIKEGGFTDKMHTSISKVLNCSSLIELGMPKLNEGGGALVSQDCSFPGSVFYYSTQQLWGILNQYNQDAGLQSRIQGWLTDYHIQHRFGNPGQLKILVRKLDKITTNLYSMINPVSKILMSMFDNYTVTEWVDVNLRQRISRLNDKSQKAKLLLQQTTWPRRPLHDLIPENRVQDINQIGRAGQKSPYDVQMQQDKQYDNRKIGNPNEQKFPGVQNQMDPKFQQGQYNNRGRQNLPDGGRKRPGFDNQGQLQDGKGRLQGNVKEAPMRMNRFPDTANSAQLKGFGRNQVDGGQGRFQDGNKINAIDGIGNQEGLKEGAGRRIGQFQDVTRRNPLVGNQEGLKGGAGRLSQQLLDGNRRNAVVRNQEGSKDGAGRRSGQFQDATRRNQEGLKEGAGRLSRQFPDDNRRNAMIGNQEGLKDGTERLSRGGARGALQDGKIRVDDNWRNQGVVGNQNIRKVPRLDKKEMKKVGGDRPIR